MGGMEGAAAEGESRTAQGEAYGCAEGNGEQD